MKMKKVKLAKNRDVGKQELPDHHHNDTSNDNDDDEDDDIDVGDSAPLEHSIKYEQQDLETDPKFSLLHPHHQFQFQMNQSSNITS